MNVSFKGYFNYKGTYYNTDTIESIARTKSMVNNGTVINFKQPVNSPCDREKIKSIYLDKANPKDVASYIHYVSKNDVLDTYSIEASV